MNYTDFRSVLQRNQVAPVYLFHGEEDYLIEEGVQALIERTLDEGSKGFNLDVMYGSRVEVQEVVAHASSFPMMSERRVVVVKEFEKLATSDTAKEVFAAYLERPLASTCLILVSTEPDFRRKPFTDAKKHAELVECKALYDNQVLEWLNQQITREGKRVSPEACRLLQAYVGNSLRALRNEIDKIFIYVGEKTAIEADDVTAVVGASKGHTVFELQNAVGRKDLKEALRILQEMLASGQSPQLILVMLTRFFNQLWKISELKTRRVSDSEMSREAGVHPFFLKQLLQFQAHFSTEDIEKNYQALLEADTTLKSTSRDPRLVLDLLVYGLVRGVQDTERIMT